MVSPTREKKPPLSRLGAGDQCASRPQRSASAPNEDSDDDALFDLDGDRRTQLGRSASSHGCSTAARQPWRQASTSWSTGDLRQDSAAASSVRGRVAGSRAGGRTRSRSADTVVLDGEEHSVQEIRSLLLRIKSKVLDGDLSLFDKQPLPEQGQGQDQGQDRQGQEQEQGHPPGEEAGAGAEADRQGKKLDFPAWLLRKQAEDKQRRRRWEEEADRKRREEEQEEEMKARRKQEDKENFREWVQRKREQWEKEKEEKASELKQREELQSEEERKKEESRLKAEAKFQAWKAMKEKLRLERLEKERLIQEEKQRENQIKKIRGEEAFQDWLKKQKCGSEAESVMYVNPEPWVDIVTPPDSQDEASAEPPRRSRGSRAKRRRDRLMAARAAQQLAMERLSRPRPRDFTLPADPRHSGCLEAPEHPVRPQSSSAATVTSRRSASESWTSRQPLPPPPQQTVTVTGRGGRRRRGLPLTGPDGTRTAWAQKVAEQSRATVSRRTIQ